MITELAIVGVRLMGVYMIVGVGMPALMAVGAMVSTRFGASGAPQLLWLCMPIPIGIVLILMSRTIAGWIAPASAVESKVAHKAMSDESILRVGSLLIALWLAGTAVIDLVAALTPGGSIALVSVIAGKSIYTVLAQFMVAGALFMMARK